MNTVGYGNLSGRGKRELHDTAVRLEQRLPGLFARIAEDQEPIDVVSSGQGRAVDSGNTFAAALAETDPQLKPLIGATRTDKDLLYFHKAAGGAAYRDYIANDERLANTLTSITDQPATHAAARSVLRKLFKSAFVDRISNGEFSTIASDVEAATAVYNLYAIAPAMSDEAKHAGTSDLGAELRFTHAEELIPLAALMGLPGSTDPATADQPYTYADNPWRGASVAPLGGNIQWDVFRKDDTYLVRMLYNEQETAFKTACHPIAKSGKFYDLEELERCFGRTDGGS